MVCVCVCVCVCCVLCVDELEARVQDGGKFEVKGLYMYVLHRGRCVWVWVWVCVNGGVW